LFGLQTYKLFFDSGSKTTRSFKMSDKDFFSGVFEYRPSTMAGISVATIFGALASIMMIGILWYERFGSDSKRTILNKLVSVMYINCLIWALVVQVLEICRYISGPMFSPLCYFHSFLKNCLAIHLSLATVTNSFLRFLFLFILKNPEQFHDDFWILFINLWIIGFAMISQGVFFLENKSIGYYLCCGIELPADESKRFNMTLYFTILFCLMIQIGILGVTFIILWKKRSRMNTSIIQSFNEGLTVDMRNQSLGNFTMAFSHILGICLIAMLLRKVNGIASDQLNIFPNYLWVDILHLHMPAICFCLVTTITYLGHKHLPNTIFQELTASGST